MVFETFFFGMTSLRYNERLNVLIFELLLTMADYSHSSNVFYWLLLETGRPFQLN